MQTFDNETMIIECFSDLKSRDIFMMGNGFSCQEIYLSIKGLLKNKAWINSSEKNDPPPDFYNDKDHIMMEVMRFDDHAYEDKKGHIHNESLKHEGEIYKKYFKDMQRDDLKLFIIPDTKLPTNEDHNFNRYYSSFKRVFEKHASKIDLYKSHHPSYKMIFFVFDESSAYIQTTNKASLTDYCNGKDVMVMPHYPFLDRCFIDIIKQSKVDYVIWYSPYKLLQYNTGKRIKILPLPKGIIIDVANIHDDQLRDYNYELMASSEK